MNLAFCRKAHNFNTGLVPTLTSTEVRAKDIYILGQSEYWNSIIYLKLITYKLLSWNQLRSLLKTKIILYLV